MAFRQPTLQPPAREREDLAMTQAWETNDYIDFMAAILVGVALTALALSVM